MKLHELSPAKGSKHSKKRVGRGPGSGLGKTAGPRREGPEVPHRLQQPARASRAARCRSSAGCRSAASPTSGKTEYAVVNLVAARRARGRGHARVAGRAAAWSAPARTVKVLGRRRDRQGRCTSSPTSSASRPARRSRPRAARCEELPGVIESFRNIFAIPDLRKRVLFTFGAARRSTGSAATSRARASIRTRCSSS